MSYRLRRFLKSQFVDDVAQLGAWSVVAGTVVLIDFINRGIL